MDVRAPDTKMGSRERYSSSRKVTAFTKTCVAILLLTPVLSVLVAAQTGETLPEGDVYLKLSSAVRTSFQVKVTRDGGEPTQAEIGPSIDFYLRPWAKLGDITHFDLDDSKGQPLIFSIGYRYLPQANGAPATNRMEPVVTLNLPAKIKFLLTDRNRADLDWSNGAFSWRYRNRFQAERSLTIRSYHPAPYASVEFYYESRYAKWSDTTVYAGCIFPLGKHVEFDPYYEHQNNTGPSPNQQVNALGLILNFYFGVR